ncbi:hypothetical protein Tco_0709032, partial [Tanacetum coccineum]
ELRSNTFSGSDHEDANEHIERVLEIVDLFHIPNITIDQVMLRAFPMSLTGAILDSRDAIPSKTAADAKVAIQEMAKYSQKWHNGTSKTRSTETSDGLAAIQAQLNNLGREIKKVNEKVYAAQVGCEQCKGGGYRATTLGFYQKNNANPSYQEQRQSMKDTLSKFMGELAKRHEENSNLIKEIRASTDAAIRNQGASIKTLEIQIGYARGYKVPLILERPFLSTARDKIDVYKRNITLRVGEERIIFKSVKPASSLIKRFYMLSLRETMELDLEARLMRETLVLNRSLDPLDEDYIELNNLNVPIELRRDQVDDLMPTIEEGEVVKEFRARNDARMFSCMIGFEFLHANFFPVLYVNVMSKKFHNSIMKDKLEYKGNNIVGALMNVPIFVGTFSVTTDFAVLEDMDDYRDEGIGDVIFGEPFLREVGIKARRFNGMITIYSGNDEVTYEMVRSDPRFKHHTNVQCNKIPPLLKDPILSEYHQWNNGSYSGMLACMRWNGEKKLEDKSNLKTLL